MKLGRDPGCKTWLEGIDPEFVTEMRSHQKTGPGLQNYQLHSIWEDLANNRLVHATKYLYQQTGPTSIGHCKRIIDKTFQKYFGFDNMFTDADKSALAANGVPIEFAGDIRVRAMVHVNIEPIVMIWRHLKFSRLYRAVDVYVAETGYQKFGATQLLEQLRVKHLVLGGKVIQEIALEVCADRVGIHAATYNRFVNGDTPL